MGYDEEVIGEGTVTSGCLCTWIRQGGVVFVWNGIQRRHPSLTRTVNCHCNTYGRAQTVEARHLDVCPHPPLLTGSGAQRNTVMHFFTRDADTLRRLKAHLTSS